MTFTRLDLSRAQVLAFRRAAGALDERLPPGAASLRVAAWAGLQDSMPRAALLSIHARVAGTGPDALDDPSLAQVWGPRFSVYVIAEQDVAPFTLGRLPDEATARRRAEDMAARLEATLRGATMTYRDAGKAAGVSPNAFRYGTATGTIRVRWEGAGPPLVWTAPRPPVDPREARVELARRYLHVLGPGTAEGFGAWAGIRPRGAADAFARLGGELVPVGTPLGDAWILAGDEAAIRAAPAAAPAPARLLPSGDAYWLCWGRDRELLVADPARRAELWTPRVWPGALLVGGEIAGTWRRADTTVGIRPWRPLEPAEREAVEAEAAALPLPGATGPMRVDWLG